MGCPKLPSITPAGVHSRGYDLEVLKVNAFAISTQVVHLKALGDRAIDVLIVPLVGVDLLAMLVLKRPIARWVFCASPFPAAVPGLRDMIKKPNQWVGFGSSTLGNLLHTGSIP
jgi:hypothetical protein